MLAEDQSCSNSSASEDLCASSCIGEANIRVGVEGADSFGRRSTSRKSFRSFLTVVDATVSGGKYLVNFPAELSFPQSAEVVSFSIYTCTLRFFEFFLYNRKKENQNFGVVQGLADGNPSSVTQPDTLGLEEQVICQESHDSITYKPSRVFSSSPHHLIGLVLKSSFDASVDSCEKDLKSKNFVVVVKLQNCSMERVCIVNLDDLSPGPGLGREWVDFQFMGSLLVCLDTSGLIYLFDSKTANLVGHFSVLQSCGLESTVYYRSNQRKEAANEDSSPTVRNSENDANQSHETIESKRCIEGIAHARAFRSLMVAPHSFLLASVDEQGFIYITHAKEHVSEKCSHYPDSSMLAVWNAAGCGLGGQKVLPSVNSHPVLDVSDLSIEDFSDIDCTKASRMRKKNGYYMEGKGSQPNSYASGFKAALGAEGCNLSRSESEVSCTPIRRIYLPLDRFEKSDSICFSAFGITRFVRSLDLKLKSSYRIVHSGLYLAPSALDERDFYRGFPRRMFSSTKVSSTFGESIGVSYQGCLYLVTQNGLYVVLPSVSVSSHTRSAEFLRYWQPTYLADSQYKFELLAINDSRELWKPWQIEVLDRLLLYEGPEEADRMCLENEWDLKLARMRRMQLSLHYLKTDEIEKSLHMLVHVNLAEEGVLRLLFTCVYRIFRKFASDNEVALASRLLSLAACFATKMVRRYGLVEQKTNKFTCNLKKNLRISYSQPIFLKHTLVDISNSRRLSEMSHLLEVIRNLQTQLTSKSRRPGLGVVLDARVASIIVDTDAIKDDSPSPIVTMDAASSGLLGSPETQPIGALAIPAPEFASKNLENIAPLPTDLSVSAANSKELCVYETAAAQTRKWVPMENSKDMIARWEIDNLDLKTVVKDALQSSRLPLAVLQLHIQRQKDSAADKELHDTFSEVRHIGRAIAYDLFRKGESELAVATLQRLGEDMETILRQLVFGAVRRSLRSLLVMVMESYGYLRPHELRTLERISVIERLYPSSSFSKTFLRRQKKATLSYSGSTSPEADRLEIVLHVINHATIKCGDIDGVVIGSWPNDDESSTFSEDCEDNDCAGYWVCAAVWSDAWDHITMDRIVLDEPFHRGIDIQWESQLAYHLSHNDLDEVFQLIDVIPSSSLSEGSLKVSMNHPISPEKVESNIESPNHQLYICAAEDLEPVCVNIPGVKILRFPIANSCSSMLKTQVEQELAKKFIFFHDVWESTAAVIALFARAELIIDASKISIQDKSSTVPVDVDVSSISKQFGKDYVQALHKLVYIYCIQYNLPRLLDLYLDHCNLLMDDHSLSSLLEAAGECQWAKWLLLSRFKGHEYEASFSNARSNLFHDMTLGSKFGVQETDEVIRTVDDMAEGGGELAALATLMHTSSPLQKCICSGSVKRNCSLSYQCTLENLRPGLQHFPTLWKVLVASCFGQDLDGCLSSSKRSTSVFPKSALSDYLNWRDSIFTSAGGDTSLMQMLPGWFPKSIRRLITLFVQGPSGWQTLSGVVPFRDSFLHRDDSNAFSVNGDTGYSAISWEAAIQRTAEKELYSSLEDNDFGVEQHLQRGRALAAFNHFLGVRALKLKAMKELSGQASIQSDVQMLLAPLSENEGSLLSCVMPLAIMHFDNSVLVASCAFLLELCGLSASTLRVDIAALRRISSYYNTIENDELISPKSSSFNLLANEVDLTASLARALADEYIHHGHIKNLGSKDVAFKVSSSNQPSRHLLTILQHLEKASMPLMDEGRTCGFWLSSGVGDGSEFRSQQKDASQHWSLVTAFCQAHRLPLSTKYLGLLANDNDWVGFLTEAQIGRYPNDVVIEVAAREFSDPRLRTHISTVLRSMQLTKTKNYSPINSSNVKGNKISFLDGCDVNTPVELFGLLAECERQKNPGEALLVKAKDLRWSLLAIIASCFSDVSPLSCLTVWLEITAARETSSIKVNDINSKITNCVGAAIEATNRLPMESRNLTFRYNRRSPKRRRLMDPALRNLMKASSHNSDMPSQAIASIAEEISFEEESKRTVTEQPKAPGDPDEGLASLSTMVSVLCEQHLFLPLLRAFEMFLPSCSLLPFIRSLQAFSQMRLSESSAHLASFSARIKEEPLVFSSNMPRDGQIKPSWIGSTAVKAAEAVLATCPSAYEKRCLLQLLAAADFGDGGSASAFFRRRYWKINLAEPSLRKDDSLYLGNEALDDASLLTALEKNGHWEQARNWARQLESTSSSWSSSLHHVTETQAESMVAEWKEFLWDMPEERYALWNNCQSLFMRYSFPPLQAGMFFLKHAESIEKEIQARELHEMLLLSLQWLSGTMTQSNPVYPLHLLREIETRVWLLAVESEAQSKAESDFILHSSVQNLSSGNSVSIIEHTASVIAKMDNHINSMRTRPLDKNEVKETIPVNNRHLHVADIHNLASGASGTRMKRRAKNYLPNRRPIVDSVDSSTDSNESPNFPHNFRTTGEMSKNVQLQEESVKIEASVSGWEEKVRPADLERAVLSLLDFGQITAAKQLQNKLSPTLMPSEIVLVDAALKLATLSSSSSSGEVSESVLDSELLSLIDSSDLPRSKHMIDALQALESLATKCAEGSGLGVCRRIIAVVKAAKVLGVSFSEAFEKPPVELLQLLSLKAQDSLEEAKLLVETHTMPPPSIARILAESFLKGLLAAHRGGYMDSQKEEGPAPLLWRFSDFFRWAELCPSEQEIGHELMRLVMTGQDIPHACEVELLILSHHFYKSSSCLDAVDVLVTLARNRVETYVLEGDFSCLARLITGVSNFRPLNFILNILIENGQLELLLQRYSTAETATGTAEPVRGFRMAVLTSLKLFSPHDLDAFALVYNHFDMKHETASLLESRSLLCIQQWFSSRNKESQTEDLLEAMRHLIEAAEVHSTIDAGQKTHHACARASLLSLQIRIPDLQWLELSETNARRVLVDQSRFQEALIVAEAYNLNQPSEWALVLWNQMLKPDLVEEFVAEFVAVLPLQSSMLLDLARFYRAEVAARGDQSHFSMWLSPGGLPAEWVKHLGRSFRSLLKRTRDLRVRIQLATLATGFGDVIDSCNKVLDKVPDNAGPLILRKGHGGAYLPLM